MALRIVERICLACPGKMRDRARINKAALQQLRADPVMAALVERVGPVRLRPRHLPPYQSIIHAVIHQQLSGSAAATILARFQAALGNGAFPSPEAIAGADQETLRAAGLSRAKASYVRNVAQKAVDGSLLSEDDCDRMTDTEIIERLVSIKGVGRWTAEMLLIFNLGRKDVLPVHDLGVRRGYQIAYRKRRLPEPEQLDRVGRQWAPYRTTAALYLWRSADFLEGGAW